MQTCQAGGPVCGMFQAMIECTLNAVIDYSCRFLFFRSVVQKFDVGCQTKGFMAYNTHCLCFRKKWATACILFVHPKIARAFNFFFLFLSNPA